jgi:predicted PurR-regulated permease PerM
VLASLTLAPLVRLLGRVRIGRGIATLLVVVLVMAGAAGLFALLRDPAQALAERMPVALEHVEHRMQELRRPLRAATKATETIMNLAENDPAKNAVRVVVPTPSPIGYVLKQLPAIFTSMIASVFLIFLFLLHGEDLLHKLVRLMPAMEAKKGLVAGTREAQSELSRYLLSITLINTCLGLATAAGLFAIGMDDPLLWAGVVALLNFAPYIGPAASALLLLLAGFDDNTTTLQALAAPGIFLTLHMLESQLVTPHLVGRQLALDPVVIFLALMIFGWLWGILGLLMAVPILSCLKVLAQRIEGGEPWAALILATPRGADPVG